MRILVLGGTQFIGRQIAQALLLAGHGVTSFTRGKSSDDLPAEVERLRGDRDRGASGLEALKDRSWDACVDVSGYTPAQVRPSAQMLSAHVKRYIFVSAVSVYGDPQDLPVLESHPRIAPAGQDVAEIDAQTYGPLKVACEDVVQHAYGDRCTLLRPQIVVGPLDQRGRYAYWVQRAMQAGEMLAPGDGSDHLQVIDVRDVGRFARTVIERDDLSGAFNLAGPRLPWAEFMKLLGARNIVWVSAEIIKAAGVTESELPLFRPERGARSGLMDVSNHRARSAGLVLTDPQVTMRDMRAWILEHTTGSTLANTLSPEREAELIRMSRTVQNPSGRVGN